MADLTKAQLLAALERHGMKPAGGNLQDPLDGIGYVYVLPGYSVSRHNGGATRRDQLAYLLKRQAAIKRQRRRHKESAASAKAKAAASA